jgi:hypothetical protein
MKKFLVQIVSKEDDSFSKRIYRSEPQELWATTKSTYDFKVDVEELVMPLLSHS